MLPALSLVQNYDWVWQQRGCVISSHFQQISLITGYVLMLAHAEKESYSGHLDGGQISRQSGENFPYFRFSSPLMDEPNAGVTQCFPKVESKFIFLDIQKYLFNMKIDSWGPLFPQLFLRKC